MGDDVPLDILFLGAEKVGKKSLLGRLGGSQDSKLQHDSQSLYRLPIDNKYYSVTLRVSTVSLSRSRTNILPENIKIQVDKI